MKAAIYARYSSDNQREESIDAQIRAIKEYAERNSITIAKVYTDEARSATTADRPGFLQMVKDSALGIFDAVIVHKLDRFSRDRYDSAFYKRQLKRNGVKLISVLEQLDDSPESIILESVLEGMAEYYSANLAREVMKGMKETAYECKHTGGRPPLGYDVDTKTKKYIINEQEAKAVRLIFSIVLEGGGYGEVIDKLNSLGFKTKTGRHFGKNSIHDILRNEKYAGVYVFNRAASAKLGKRNNRAEKPEDEIIRIPGGMPAIISHDDWKKVQKLMSERKRGPQPRRSNDSLYILTGKVTCGECEGAMTGNSGIWGRAKKKYRFYSCSTRKRTKQCSMPNIRKEVLEQFVLDEIQKLFEPSKAEELASRVLDHYREQSAESGDQRKYLLDQLSAIKQRMDNLFDALETGAMEASVAGPRLNSLAKEKETFEEALEELEFKSQLSITHTDIVAYLKKNQDIVADRSNANACKKLVDTYVDKVIVYRDRVVVMLKFGGPSDNGGGGGPHLTLSETTHRAQLYARY